MNNVVLYLYSCLVHDGITSTNENEWSTEHNHVDVSLPVEEIPYDNFHLFWIISEKNEGCYKYFQNMSRGWSAYLGPNLQVIVQENLWEADRIDTKFRKVRKDEHGDMGNTSGYWSTGMRALKRARWIHVQCYVVKPYSEGFACL